MLLLRWVYNYDGKARLVKPPNACHLQYETETYRHICWHILPMNKARVVNTHYVNEDAFIDRSRFA